MNLWERDFADSENVLEPLSAPARLKLAITALDHALRTEPHPIEDREARQWIEGSIATGQAAVTEGATHVVLPADLDEQFEDLDESVEEYGVGQLMAGMMACVDFESLSAEALSNVLYACYTFTMMRQEPEPTTLEEEQANPRCLETIAYHRELMNAATA
jgi:hypothetical protein